MKRELAIEFSRVTEAAALAGYKWLGRGDKNIADGAAVEAMRYMLNDVDVQLKLFLGEEIDDAPMLYIGESAGKLDKGDAVDIAVDPIEGTRSLYGTKQRDCSASCRRKRIFLEST